jgi:glycosyltransferase involved in cell wall biosynthesis
MKIGISSPYLEGLTGGERYMLTIASYLSSKHKVSIFWNDKKIKERAQKRFSIGLEKVKVARDIFYPSTTLGAGLRSQQKLLEKLNKTLKYDLIIFLSDGSIPLSFAKKNIIHFQTPFVNVGGRSFLNRIKLRKINEIVCNSRFTKKFIDREFGIESKVIYPPVSVNKLKPSRKANIILSVGRFHPVKKQDILIEVFKEVSQKLPNWKLVLTGGLLEQDMEYFRKLERAARKHRIKLVANLGFSRLKDLYGKARIYWHAAGFGESEEESPEKKEHFGISTVEAMASGCVPITYRGGGQREILNHADNGFLWETREELVKYTLEVIENIGLRRKIAAQAIKDSQQYNVRRFCKKINELVNNLE